MERFGQICLDQSRSRDAEEEQISKFNKIQIHKIQIRLIQIHIIQIQVIQMCANDK